jgi:DNA-binding CsgD family transcriptional regulator
LTATERRVAELAAVGHSNDEIAGLASISVKTVEANLTRVYRKLGVRSRHQLGSRLAD